jgi:hypothetical protein
MTERVAGLDDQELQRDLARIQWENVELARQLQERQFALHLRQLAAQRAGEKANGTSRPVGWRLDREVQKVLTDVYEQIARLDEGALQAELGRLQQQMQELNLQMQQRQYALGIKQMLAQRAQGAVVAMSASQFVAPGLTLNFGMPGMVVAGGPGLGPRQPDVEAKRRAILDVMRQQPPRAWSPSEVKRALQQGGMQNVDAGTPVRNLMWRMGKEGVLHRPSSGLYALPGSVGADLAADQAFDDDRAAARAVDGA